MTRPIVMMSVSGPQSQIDDLHQHLQLLGYEIIRIPPMVSTIVDIVTKISGRPREQVESEYLVVYEITMSGRALPS